MDKNPENVIYICTGSKCKKNGSKHLSKFFNSSVKKHGLKGKIEVIKTSCTDRCKHGPVVCLQPENKWFLEVDDKVAELILKDLVEPKK